MKILFNKKRQLFEATHIFREIMKFYTGFMKLSKAFVIEYTLMETSKSHFLVSKDVTFHIKSKNIKIFLVHFPCFSPLSQCQNVLVLQYCENNIILNKLSIGKHV